MLGQWATPTRFWAVAIGAGLLSGVMYLSGASISMLGAMILGYFGQLPLFLVGLSFGAAASVVASAITALIVIIRTDLVLGLVFAAVMLVPVAVLSRQSLLFRRNADGSVEWYPPGLIAGWLVSIGIAAVLLLCFALYLQDGAEATMRQLATKMVEIFEKAGATKLSAVNRDRTIETMAAYFPGMVVASVILSTAVNGSLAQRLLSKFGVNQRPSPDMAELNLPTAFAAVFAASVICGLILPGDLGYAVRNITPVVLFGLVLSGLAVVHSAVRRLSGRRWILAVVYVIAFAQVWPLLMLAAVGIAEPFVGLKQRLARLI